MKIRYYIDPDAEPWLVENTGGYLYGARGATIPIEGDGYRILLHFSRTHEGSSAFYLVKATSEWDDAYIQATKDML